MSVKEISPRNILDLKKAQHLDLNQENYTLNNPVIEINISNPENLIERIMKKQPDINLNNLIFAININLNTLPDIYSYEINLNNIINSGFSLNLLDITKSKESELIYYGSTPKYWFHIYDKSTNNIVANWQTVHIAKHIDPLTGETYNQNPLFEYFPSSNLNTLWEVRMNSDSYPQIFMNINEEINLKIRNPERFKVIRDVIELMATKECIYKLFTEGEGASDEDSDIYKFLRAHNVSKEIIENANKEFADSEITTEKIINVNRLIDELFKSEKIKNIANARNEKFYKTMKEI